MRYLFWSDGGRGRTDYDWQRLHMVHSDVYLNPSHRPFAAVYRGVNEMELPCAQSEHFDASGQVSTEMIEEFLKKEYATMDDLTSVFGKGSKGNVFVCFDPDIFDAQAKKYARIVYKVAKKWRSYGFAYLDIRDPEFPSVTLKLLVKPPQTFTKSFAKEELTEKSLAQSLSEMPVAVMAPRKGCDRTDGDLLGTNRAFVAETDSQFPFFGVRVRLGTVPHFAVYCQLLHCAMEFSLSRWYEWQSIDHKSWVESKYVKRFPTVEKQEAIILCVAETKQVSTCFLGFQILHAFQKTFYAHLQTMFCGVCFLQAARAWPEEILRKVLSFNFNCHSVKFLMDSRRKASQMCLTESRASAEVEVGRPSQPSRKMLKKSGARAFKQQLKALRKRGIWCILARK
ncbi:bdbA [Symbiodinium natans]|uniref:BdbA protein n=1 Tax=Symbiodinium natans TaxID=878477 RepID=A0A812JFV4_9DINO|nr:bdbA [Symbiodinium natans]